MTLRLSSAELAALARASTVFLSPFAYDTSESWRRAAAHGVEYCIGGDSSSFALPVPGESLIAADPDVMQALRVLDPPPDWIIQGLTVRRRTLGLTVTDWDELFEPNEIRRTSFYNEVVVPQRLLAPLSMLGDLGPSTLPATLSVYFDEENSARRDGHRQKQIMRLLFPSFCAGVKSYLEFAGSRQALTAIAEDAPIGVVVFDAKGNTRWENEFFRRLMESDPARERVRVEVARAGRACIQAPRFCDEPTKVRRVNKEVRTSGGHYRIAATFSDAQSLDGTSRPIALIDRIENKPMTAGELALSFSLTPREIQAAQLLRRGLSTCEIAGELQISTNTVRRHVEQILLKLDVHTRTAAAAKLSHGCN
jgi:DNA-binding NarL/FixJ family response regulator